MTTTYKDGIKYRKAPEGVPVKGPQGEPADPEKSHPKTPRRKVRRPVRIKNTVEKKVLKEVVKETPAKPKKVVKRKKAEVTPSDSVRAGVNLVGVPVETIAIKKKVTTGQLVPTESNKVIALKLNSHFLDVYGDYQAAEGGIAVCFDLVKGDILEVFGY